MAEPVYVIGAGRTDFKRNFKKEGGTIRHILLEAARSAIAQAGIDPADIQAGVVGNFAGGLFTRQLHLGAFLPEIDERLRGIPTIHVEAACASGGVAVLSAAQQIIGGLHDVVLVVGVEQQKTMSPSEGAEVLGAAGDYHEERPQYGEFMFPKLFARIAQLYRESHGLTDQQLALVAVKNHAHARRNPLAQMRDSALSLKEACTESEANPRLAPPLKLTDCSQITDGGAGLILCSGRFLKSLSRRVAVRLLGYGHTTDCLPLERKDAPEFSIARKAAERAYAMAGVHPGAIQAAEVHDCFSISEILAYEILGFAPRGGGPRLLESGATMLPDVRSQISDGTPPFNLPVNPGGGLMGDGHPVGATGVRQVVEGYCQLTRSAGEHQVQGVERFLTFNMGGSVTTSVVMIWGLP
jgi:acetyl-CoA acetyltransferase